EHRRHQEIRPLHRPHQLDLRLHHLLRDALRLRLLGSRARLAFSNRLVRRVADHANADRPRHPHEQASLYPRPRELAAHDNDRGYHGGRRLAALLAGGTGAWVHRIATPLLADPARDAAQLCRAHPGSEDVADPQGVALSQLRLDRSFPYRTRAAIIIRSWR